MTEETGRPHTAAHAATTEWRWRHGAVGRAARDATRLAVFTASSLLPGCDRRDPGDPAGREAGFAIRDSAGIEIVENHFPEYSPERFWRMDMEPEIVLGGSDRWLAGDSAHLIWEVSGLARLEDERIAVLSRGNRQLYLFEPTGELSRVMGREGRGPGEFGGPAELQYDGASSALKDDGSECSRLGWKCRVVGFGTGAGWEPTSFSPLYATS